MKKIAILTQPLKTNYGGLLQAFALQFVLKKRGHNVLTIDIQTSDIPLRVKFFSIAKRLVLNIFCSKGELIRVWPNTNEQKQIAQHTNRFIKENIQTTDKIFSLENDAQTKKYSFDTYIVGSDQVWRPEYSACVTNYFLDFISNPMDNVKRIAYAASFGVDNWEFSIELTNQCATLIKNFDAISVREDSAVKLCEEYLGVDAIHVLDPTMLLSKEDYISLIEKDNIPKKAETLMTYVLDKSPQNSVIIQYVAKELDLSPFSVMPEKVFSEAGRKNLDACVFPPVTEWLRGFMDADYVITDSFHGTVFSIIFNKPFIAIANPGRGLTRFTSLLKLFDLEERLILSSDELTSEMIRKPIDFIRVNTVWKNERHFAFAFLDKSLKN
jgi:exopolysaccharide biosynthesis predicted pyruvyltransferase EpsI